MLDVLIVERNDTSWARYAVTCVIVR